MESLLVLVALGGFVVGLISLVRPIQKLRIRDRRHAAIVLAASFFVMTVGVVISPAPTTDASPTTTAETPEATTTQVPTTTLAPTTTRATTTTRAPSTTLSTTTTQATTTTMAPTTTTTEPEIELSEEVIDQLYLLAVRGYSAEFEDITWVDLEDDQVLVSLAHQWCEQFDEGSSFKLVSLAMVLVLDDMYGESLVDADYELIGFAIGAAVGGYCPEHMSLIEKAASV